MTTFIGSVTSIGLVTFIGSVITVGLSPTAMAASPSPP